LLAFATQPRFVYGHKWRIGDLVMGDNRCTMHRASPFESNDYKREMRRSSTRAAIDRSRHSLVQVTASPRLIDRDVGILHHLSQDRDILSDPAANASGVVVADAITCPLEPIKS
jgi:hypothetical protein